MGRNRNESGRYNDRIDPATVLDVFDDRDDQSRPLTASDIVDALGIARRTAHNKLNALVERGELETRKVGARGRVWWTPTPADDGRTDATRDGPQDAESGPGATTDRSPATGDDVQAGGQTAPGDTARDDAPAHLLDEWRPGRSPGEKREQQQAAGRAVLEYLRDRGAAKAAEFREDVEPNHPVAGQSPMTWWKKTARPALNEARDPGPVTFKDGKKEWRWRPDADT